jgi:hypothetical protein
VLAAVPLQERAKPWGPVITFAQAMAMPNMNRPEGRSSIVDERGQIAWVCSARVGYLPEALPCRWNTFLVAPVNALLLVPLFVLGIRGARGKPEPERAERNLLYLHAVVACTVCFVAAALFAFKLHFPGRYTQRVLGPLEWLAIGQMLGGWLVTKSAAWRGGVIALLAVLAATPLPGFVRPADPGLIRFVRRLPVNVRIAGISEELAVIPAMTGRAITAAPEQAIPWHMGYYRPFERALRASLAEASATTPARSGEDYFMVDRAFLQRSEIPKRYAQIVPDAVAQARAALTRRPSALQRRAGACAVYRGETVWLLDSRCLATGV